MTPEIVAPNLLIVPFAETDLCPAYVEWLNDRELMRYSEQRLKRHTLESCRAYLRSFQGTPHHFWALRHATLGLVGTMTAYLDPVRGDSADLGILVGHPQARGRGLGREAWGAVMETLLGPLGLGSVTAGTLEINTPMRRVMEGTGMQRLPEKEHFLLWESRQVLVVKMVKHANMELRR